MTQEVEVQIGWGVLYGNSGGPQLGWLRTGGIEIHGIREYMSLEEAESEIVKDAALNPDRIGTYQIRPLFEGWCGNPVPCAECRVHLSKFKG
jgi:hypothetical protein